MSSMNGMLKPNARILLGILWILIALIYITYRLVSNLEFRILDWIGLIAMFFAGAISIAEGIRINKNNLS